MVKVGDKVGWDSNGGHSIGKVVKKLTKPMTIKGHKVAASKENPAYLVETSEGKKAAHKPSALTLAAAATPNNAANPVRPGGREMRA